MASDIQISFGNLTRADGSAVVAMGNTVVQAAIFGPAEVPYHKEVVDRATLEVSFKTAVRSKESTPESKMIQDWIRCAADDIIRADLHPRTSIQMILQELESDGHLLSPAINCLSCALLDSGIPLKSLMASSTAAIMPDGDVKLDPCHQVTKESKSLFTFVFDGVSASAISIKSEGAPFTRQELNTCHDLCRLKCKDIFGSLKEKIKQRLE